MIITYTDGTTENAGQVNDTTTSPLSYVLLSDGTYSVYANENAKYSSSIRIPEYYRDKKVTQISNNAFSGGLWGYTLTSIYIPNTIKYIGENAFPISVAKNGNPVNVYFEGTIGEWLNIEMANETACPLANYTRSTSGTNTNYGSSLYIGEDHKIVQNLIIPNSITKIGAYQFTHCTSITSVTVPASVTSIGKKAFYQCVNLSTATFANTSWQYDYVTYPDTHTWKDVTASAYNLKSGTAAEYEWRKK